MDSFVAPAMVRMDSPSRWRAMMMRRFSALTTRGRPSGPVAFASCVEAVAGFAGDVASAIFDQGEYQIKDEVAFGVFARGDPREEVAAQSVDFLHGEHVPASHVVDCCCKP